MALRWRFSLKWVLIGFAAASVWLAMFAHDLRRDRLHERAIAELRDDTSRVALADETIESNFSWAKSLIGFDSPQRVLGVTISAKRPRPYLSWGATSTLTPDRVARISRNLARLRDPDSLTLHLENPDGELLDALGRCPALDRDSEVRLSFDDGKIECTPEALSVLKGTSVTILHASGREFTDDHMLALGEPTALWAVRLCDASLTSRGLSVLARAPRLNSLHVDTSRSPSELLAGVPTIAASTILKFQDCDLTKADFHLLQVLSGIERLSIERSTVDSAALETLPELPTLEALHLSGNEWLSRVSDDLLSRLPSLIDLDVSWTGLSLADCEHIRQHFPKVKVKCEGILE
ncbi:hypothetical protein Pla123a_07840 [Posidoniimonas polymericola]|uniref:Leucine Rich repeats (2 copies) n=1 Tax=Posidoniimonas polymericola TaxID=2528002 RepID=A0A5C5ZFK8_9BACT|nr:hypothetical protein [Posidoniimonas polymericola]TWT85976.1 hypothetical protein Pla123a_07840 [Posidoniimonas polymericola]